MELVKTFKYGVAAMALTALGGLVSAVQADHHGGAIMKAVESPDRPAADRERDPMRKPAEVLKFAGVAPGMTVLDINAAGGYYTEILSRVVGETGTVYSHNGPVYWAFMKQTVPARFEGGQLANVQHIHDGHETFSLAPNSVDMAISVLAYHDYYFTHDARPGGGHEDVPAVLKSLYEVMKPGGKVIIVDHVAPANSKPEDFDKLHRIDPAFVKAQMLAVGFALEGETDALSNQNDAHTGSPFAPEMRGKTDRFVFKFVKK